MAGRILFVFIDGFGLAPAAASNPLSAETMPALTALLGTEPLAGLSVDRPGLLARGIDARLGVEGLPQSATGQTSLFAGVNAAAALGSHLPAYPNRHLAGLLKNDNILKHSNSIRIIDTNPCLLTNHHNHDNKCCLLLCHVHCQYRHNVHHFLVQSV